MSKGRIVQNGAGEAGHLDLDRLGEADPSVFKRLL